jgi:hypothetical protein
LGAFLDNIGKGMSWHIFGQLGCANVLEIIIIPRKVPVLYETWRRQCWRYSHCCHMA